MVYVSVQLADEWVTTREYRNIVDKSTAWATAFRGMLRRSFAREAEPCIGMYPACLQSWIHSDIWRATRTRKCEAFSSLLHAKRRKGKHMVDLTKEISSTTYPGRGIILGTSEDGKYAVCAYFIMGRSENSRNRVFVEEGQGIRTEAFDPSKMEDPSLIIYAPVRVRGTSTIVTNGDQTDTIYELMQAGQSFEESLRTREFEPDAPNYTPRISGLMDVKNGQYNFQLSILSLGVSKEAIVVYIYFSLLESVLIAQFNIL